MVERHLGRAHGRRGEFRITLTLLFWIFLFMVAYLLYPQVFHDFVHWVINYVYDALEASFGSPTTSPVETGVHPQELPKVTPLAGQ